MLQVEKQGEIGLGVAYLNKGEICKDFWSRLMTNSRKILR